MKNTKRIMVLIACVVLMWGQTVRAVAIPMIPYIPPHDVQMFDMLFNAFGLTVPDIEDDAKRLEGYWKLFEMSSIANIEATKALIQKAFDNAKTSRVIELSPEDIDSMRLVGKVAINQGVESGGVSSVTQSDQIYQYILEKLEGTNIHFSTSQYGTFVNAANGKFGTGNWILYMCVAYWTTGSGQIALGAVGKNSAVPLYYFERGGSYNSFGNAYLDNNESATRNYECVCSQYGIYSGVATFQNTYIDQYIRTNNVYGSGFSGLYIHGDTKGNVTYAPVTAQNAQISDAITQGTLIPITADTVAVEGVIDATKPLRIHLPVDLPMPAETVQDLPAVQEKLGTVPMSEDVEETITQLQEQQATQTGDITDYGVDLTRLFPFCIPFDLVRILSAFSAEPEAPHFEFPLPSDIVDNRVIFTNYAFSLDWLSPVMVWVRRGELILGGIGILLMTRDIIRG